MSASSYERTVARYTLLCDVCGALAYITLGLWLGACLFGQSRHSVSAATPIQIEIGKPHFRQKTTQFSPAEARLKGVVRRPRIAESAAHGTTLRRRADLGGTGPRRGEQGARPPSPLPKGDYQTICLEGPHRPRVARTIYIERFRAHTNPILTPHYDF